MIQAQLGSVLLCDLYMHRCQYLVTELDSVACRLSEVHDDMLKFPDLPPTTFFNEHTYVQGNFKFVSKKLLSVTTLSCSRASLQSCYESTINHPAKSLVLVRASLSQFFACMFVLCSITFLLHLVVFVV